MLCLFDRIAVLLVFFGFLLAALFEIEVNTVENDSSTQNRCIELAGSLQMTKIIDKLFLIKIEKNVK